MQYRPLGQTDVSVSELCLGTMTWGQQNTEQEAHQQIDCALDSGVNFIDTAEMYPVPPKPDTQGRTEQYLGSWLAKSGKRDQWVIATKIAGPGDWLSHIRGGSRLNETHIMAAIDTSLSRLQTDYVDLYQLHWPDRNTNFFGKLGYQADEQEQLTPLRDSIEALNKLIAQGKIRHWGLSNETPWGLMKAIALCEQQGWAAPVSIQNPYNLLNRSYEVGLAEVSHREQVGLLAYSPLAFGALTGKYLHGQAPANGRLTLFDRFTRYNNPQAVKATESYVSIAHQHGLDPAQMALAFVTQQPFVTSNILGATTLDQLQSNLASTDLKLPAEVLAQIQAVHQQVPNPSP